MQIIPEICLQLLCELKGAGFRPCCQAGTSRNAPAKHWVGSLSRDAPGTLSEWQQLPVSVLPWSAETQKHRCPIADLFSSPF